MPGFGTTDEIQDQREVIAALTRELTEERQRSRENKRLIYWLQQGAIDDAHEKLRRATKLAFEAWRQRDLASDRYRKADDAARSIYRDYCELYAAVCGDTVENAVGKLLGHECAVDDADQARIDQERYQAVRHGIALVMGQDGAMKWQSSIDTLIAEAKRDTLPNR